MTAPCAIQIPVADVGLAIKWYRRVFPDAALVLSANDKPVALSMGDFQLEPILADMKLTAARAGTVLVWKVDDLNKTLADLKADGSYVYRRPKPINDDESDCVVTDPFGNLIGLRGRYTS